MPNPPNDTVILKRELVGLFGHMQKIRKELAALNPPGSPDHFGGMSEQLDAIVAATEGATNTIMESMEAIDTLMGEARALAADNPPLNAIFDQVTDKVNMVFEACSFQDITGQRISKVVGTLKFVEERVNTIVLTWGRDELTKVAVEIKEEDPDKKLLNGPQLAGQGVTQADVDRMLGQDAIDKLFG